MHSRCVLIFEDDPFVRQLLEKTYRRAGAIVHSTPNSNVGMRLFYSTQPDLVVLDLMLAAPNGWDLLRRLRMLADTPIIILSALAAEDSVVQALGIGATDVIIKPFSPRVLVARSKAAIRKSSSPVITDRVLQYDDSYLSLNLERRLISVNGQPINLTKTEFNLLICLLAGKGQVVRFETILAEVWGAGSEQKVEYVHTYMSQLRRKLEREPKRPKYIVSEHGVGYRFGGLIRA